MHLWFHVQAIAIILTSDTTAISAAQWPTVFSPYLVFSNFRTGVLGKKLVLFFVIKVIFVSTRFFNYAQDEVLTSQASLLTQPFFSSRTPSTPHAPSMKSYSRIIDYVIEEAK